MRKLTDHQKNFILDNFFKNEDYSGWRNIATELIEEGICIVHGTRCIWIGGIGNFIKTNTKKGLIGCLEYTFDLEVFLQSEWFRATKKVELDNLLIKKQKLEKQYDDIWAIS